jgi:hypothetical protein
MNPRHPVVAVVLAGVALAGCSDPYATLPTRTPAIPPGQQPARTVTVTAPARSPSPRNRSLPATPAAAARLATALSFNWTARTAAARQARLARISVGAARRDALQAAARLSTDPQVVSGHATSAARVAAIALPESGRTRSGLLVTHERLTIHRTTRAHWRVTLLTVTRTPEGWAVSRWEPQP